MNYKFVYNPENVKEFFNFISNNEPRFAMLQFIYRSKYDPEFSSSNLQFAKSFKNCLNAESFVNEILRHQIELGLYYHYNKNTNEKYILKQYGMGCYCIPDQPNTLKATQSIVQEFYKRAALS